MTPSSHEQVMAHKLWTIGHSTRPIDEFIALLKAHTIQRLVDVRTIPRSRHNPQFNAQSLANSLADAAVRHQHVGQLGGLRKPRKDSVNIGWHNDRFRGYADHMQSEIFWNALEKLVTDSQEVRTAIMCAEAVPWRCHRSLIADALSTQGWDVQHILSDTKADQHQLTSFATFENGMLVYPKSDDRLRLF